MEAIKQFFSPFFSVMKFIQNHFKAMLFLLIAFVVLTPNEVELIPANLAKVKIEGAIMDATKIVDQLEDIRKNKQIKGVLVTINSPGGAVSPSIEIMEAIKRLKETKPVIAYAAGTMASGSYYAAIHASKIYANPGAMIGSIGVIMQGTDLSKVAEKIGISAQVVKAGKFKEVGTTSRPWEPYETKELEKVVNDTYNLFVNDVAHARNLDPKEHTEFADAHIFTASQAKNVGLIDHIGVGYDAENALMEASNIKKPIWLKEDKFDSFMRELSTETASFIGTHLFGLSLR